MSLPREARVAVLGERLSQAFAAESIDVRDDSDRHVGHEGARDGRGHFFVRLVSAQFEGQSLLARHRAIYAALGSLMQTDIHALALEALTPAEARRTPTAGEA